METQQHHNHDVQSPTPAGGVSRNQKAKSAVLGALSATGRVVRDEVGRPLLTGAAAGFGAAIGIAAGITVANKLGLGTNLKV